MDGRTQTVETDGAAFEVTRAGHTIRLVKLLGHTYFDTLRAKLMWGAGKTR
jgi:NAD kinase